MKSKKWPFIRALFQLIIWVAFIIVIVASRDTTDNTFFSYLPRISPLLGISVSLTTKAIDTIFWPALIFLALTLVLGRYFCGWICPMGATIDATDKPVTALRKKALKESRGKPNPYKSFKYALLLIIIILSIFGIQITGVFDPLSLSIRTYGTVIFAYLDMLLKTVFNALYYIPGINIISEPVYSFLRNNLLEVNEVQYFNHIPVLLFFIAVLFLSVFGRRFWCKSLCPLGAIYALTARKSLLKRHVNTDKCTNCLACEKICRTNAIHADGTATHEGECIKCFECLKACNYDAIEFKFTRPFKTKEKAAESTPELSGSNEQNIKFTRKNLLWSLTAALVAVPMFKRKPAYTKEHSRLIRPPGALEEQDFINTCIRCGQCMKVCPTNGLHPQMFEYGLDGIFTPRLIPRIGWCEKNCNQCSSVCPSGALETVPIPKKETTVIGTAYILRDFCIPWSDYTDCLVCEEMCPTNKKAIIFKEEQLINKKGEKVSVKLPYVLPDICIGCGICENKCPVQGEAAIQVHRPRSLRQNAPGSYGGY